MPLRGNVSSKGHSHGGYTYETGRHRKRQVLPLPMAHDVCHPVRVHMSHSETKSSVTSFVDFIIVFWNRFTSYASKAHVTGKG